MLHVANEGPMLIAHLLDGLDHGQHHSEDLAKNNPMVLMLRAGDLRE
jgi:hypothetical protein